MLKAATSSVIGKRSSSQLATGYSPCRSVVGKKTLLCQAEKGAHPYTFSVKIESIVRSQSEWWEFLLTVASLL